MQKAQGYSNTRTYDLVLTAILIALVFVATVFLNIKLPITAWPSSTLWPDGFCGLPSH